MIGGGHAGFSVCPGKGPSKPQAAIGLLFGRLPVPVLVRLVAIRASHAHETPGIWTAVTASPSVHHRITITASPSPHSSSPHHCYRISHPPLPDADASLPTHGYSCRSPSHPHCTTCTSSVHRTVSCCNTRHWQSLAVSPTPSATGNAAMRCPHMVRPSNSTVSTHFIHAQQFRPLSEAVIIASQ